MAFRGVVFDPNCSIDAALHNTHHEIRPGLARVIKLHKDKVQWKSVQTP